MSKKKRKSHKARKKAEKKNQKPKKQKAPEERPLVTIQELAPAPTESENLLMRFDGKELYNLFMNHKQFAHLKFK